MEFDDFPKMARWSRDVIITEKLDGTNAQVCIGEDGEFKTGSRTRWITPEDDNYGFARWAHANKDELMKLGPGRHFGEWWGQGIQRNYSMTEKHFSLFNVSRWTPETLPACCHAVPTLYKGPMHPGLMEKYIRQIVEQGSIAAPGFMKPEGVVMFHIAAGVWFKKTVDKDEMPKGPAERKALQPQETRAPGTSKIIAKWTKEKTKQPRTTTPSVQANACCNSNGRAPNAI